MYTRKKETRTYTQRREYLIKAVSQRRRTLKLKAIGIMGSQCAICSYDKHPSVLEFHHFDPTQKSFAISNGGFSRSWDSIYQEIQKCLLLCANCHREVEAKLIKKEFLMQKYIDSKKQYFS